MRLHRASFLHNFGKNMYSDFFESSSNLLGSKETRETRKRKLTRVKSIFLKYNRSNWNKRNFFNFEESTKYNWKCFIVIWIVLFFESNRQAF